MNQELSSVESQSGERKIFFLHFHMGEVKTFYDYKISIPACLSRFKSWLYDINLVFLNLNLVFQDLNLVFQDLNIVFKDLLNLDFHYFNLVFCQSSFHDLGTQ